MLKLLNLSHFYDKGNPIITNLSLVVEKGEIVSILGPSGCGKTSLLRLIAGLEKPCDGEIEINNELVSSGDLHVPPEKRNLGLVVEGKALFPHLNVHKNITFGIPAEKNKNVLAQEYLDLFKIEHLKDKYPHEISSGEQQRTSLARAMITNPSILLLDEPFSALDKELKAKLHEEIKKIFTLKKLTVILVTHDEEESAFFSNRIFKFEDNGLIET